MPSINEIYTEARCSIGEWSTDAELEALADDMVAIHAYHGEWGNRAEYLREFRAIVRQSVAASADDEHEFRENYSCM